MELRGSHASETWHSFTKRFRRPPLLYVVKLWNWGTLARGDPWR